MVLQVVRQMRSLEKCAALERVRSLSVSHGAPSPLGSEGGEGVCRGAGEGAAREGNRKQALSGQARLLGSARKGLCMLQWEQPTQRLRGLSKPAIFGEG